MMSNFMIDAAAVGCAQHLEVFGVVFVGFNIREAAEEKPENVSQDEYDSSSSNSHGGSFLFDLVGALGFFNEAFVRNLAKGSADTFIEAFALLVML